MSDQDQSQFPNIIEMQASQQADVEAVIAAAMNADEARWAKQTFDFHFACHRHGIDSTRQFYVACVENDIIGVAGLHQYRWGPEENIWLSWFAVAPPYQGHGVGKYLLREVCNIARQQGYIKIFIETYNQATFKHAVEFYQRQGFRPVGSVEQFLPDQSEMLVFMRAIDT